MATEAEKPIHAEIYAVQQQYVLKGERLELMPYFAVTLNDQVVSHNGAGARAQLPHHAGARKSA